MSLLKRREMVQTLYTVVGFNDKGEEIARVRGLSEGEMKIEAEKYHASRILESEVVTPKVYCEVGICRRVAAAVIKLHPGGEPFKVCRYHAAGVYLKFKPPFPIEDKLMWKGFVIAPDWLCFKYCPSYWERIVAGNIKLGECRAFQKTRSKDEEKKRVKGYSVYGETITVLCIEDPWWRE